MMKRFLVGVMLLIMTAFSGAANASLFLKSSGDQWNPAVADLQNSYNQGRNSNDYSRFFNVLNSRFTLDGSTSTEILNAFKAGVDNKDLNSFNDYLNTTKPQPGIPGSKGDKGDKGDTGAAGKDGVNGSDGKDGLDGKDGVNGKDGKDGATGAKGDKGDTGATGAAGADGKDGIDGKDGRDGVDGKDGAAGKDGVNGKDGLNGTNGRDGIDGKNGADGRDGVDGKDGAVGATGAQGEKGDKGDTGATGAQGVAGVDGKDGEKGDTGANGKDGLNGKDADETKIKANTEAILTESKTRAEADVAQQLRIDQVNANNEANRQAAINTNKRVAANTAAIANHEQRITSLEQSTSNGFRDLRNQIDENKRDANAGIAGVAAMANIPQVTEYQSFSVGAGLGVRGSENAVAVGASARLSQNTVGKLSVAADSQQQFTAGMGISYGW